MDIGMIGLGKMGANITSRVVIGLTSRHQTVTIPLQFSSYLGVTIPQIPRSLERGARALVVSDLNLCLNRKIGPEYEGALSV